MTEFISLDDLGPSRYDAKFACSDCSAIDDEECEPGCNCPECQVAHADDPMRTFDVATFDFRRTRR